MTNTVQHRSWIGICRRLANGTLAFVILILLLSAAVTIRSAQAQTFTVLYSFTGPDGANPFAGLVRDAAGNLYGTTVGGGDYDSGTVFNLDATGAETVLYSFRGRAGKYPYAGLIRDRAGNLYGTAYKGRVPHLGAVFKLNTAGHYKVQHTFSGADGGNPAGGLISGPGGNLYGTTETGGNFFCYLSACGTVFKLDATGRETVLHSFAGGDGAKPQARLIRDAEGNLYGTTAQGGNLHCGEPYGCGTVFKLDAIGNLTVLHRFDIRGRLPSGGLIRDEAGNLYGTTVTGVGAFSYGTVFKLNVAGQENALYTFSGGTDGAFPYSGLIRDEAGNLYGTTVQGGDTGYGTVFKLDATGQETVLYSFTGGKDGGNPYAGLIRDEAGNLYGTIWAGGAYDVGTVFKIAP